jgi:hypothetical protein
MTTVGQTENKFQLVGGISLFFFFFFVGPAGPVLSTSSKLLFHENENCWKTPHAQKEEEVPPQEAQ